MRCRASVGVWAAIILAACSNAGDDDDGTIQAGSGVVGVPGNPMAGMPAAPVAGNGMAPVGPVAGQMMAAAGFPGMMVPTAGMGMAGNVSVAGMMGMAGDMGMAGVMGMAGEMSMAGMGAAGMGAAGMAGMGTAGTMAPMVPGSPCVSAGSQVVLIGDSYSNYFLAHTSMATLMSQRATMNGAVGNYTDYAVAGTTMQNKVSGIPSQWNTAKSRTPIHLVIMDGGGNDVLIDNPSCLRDGADKTALCQMVVQGTLTVVKELFASMKATGVKDVIYFWYPLIPGGINGNGHDVNKDGLAKMQALAKETTTADFRIYMVDTIPIFEGHPEYFFGDGIHANTTGTAKIADAIWALMKEKCIGQKMGCCM